MIKTTFYNTHTGYLGDIQSYSCANTGYYKFIVQGAMGGEAPERTAGRAGYGAKVVAILHFNENQSLQVIVGQKGGAYEYDSAGGGASLIGASLTPYIVAGGGGGGKLGDVHDYEYLTAGGHLEEFGRAGWSTNRYALGGAPGQGGKFDGSRGLGGAGWFEDGEHHNVASKSGTKLSSSAGTDRAKGGVLEPLGYPAMEGGFGGGSATSQYTGWGCAGGAGGYGGGGGTYAREENNGNSGGGGSFVHEDGIFLVEESAIDTRDDHGMVEIIRMAKGLGFTGKADPARTTATLYADITTSVAVDLSFEYRELGGETSTSSSKEVTIDGEESIQITGLNPGTIYEYRARIDNQGDSDNMTHDWKTFRTAQEFNYEVATNEEWEQAYKKDFVKALNNKLQIDE